MPGESYRYDYNRLSKAFDLVPYDRLLMKLAASGVDARVAIWVREFLVGRSQRVRVGGKLSKEVKVTSLVSQRSVLSPLLFQVCVSDIWRNTGSSIRLFTDDCLLHRRITNKNDIEKSNMYRGILGEWKVENGIKINPG